MLTSNSPGRPGSFLAPTGGGYDHGGGAGAIHNMLDSGPDFTGAAMRFPSRYLILSCVLLALAACGKKGDLYLPDTPAKPQQTQAAK